MFETRHWLYESEGLVSVLLIGINLFRKIASIIVQAHCPANLDWPRYPAAPAAPLYRSTALPLSRSPALPLSCAVPSSRHEVSAALWSAERSLD